MVIRIKFCSDLAFFLPDTRRDIRFDYHLERKANLKDIIEALGVPHTEVGLILLNRAVPVPFSFIPRENLSLDVSSVPAPADFTVPTMLRPEVIDRLGFIADENVIKLGRLLILMGLNVRYSTRWSDREIAAIAEKEKRIILTRDTALLKRSNVHFARRLRSNDPYGQLKEVCRFFDLKKHVRFFSRCSRCNTDLVKVEKKAVIDRLEPRTKKYYDHFYQCPVCRQIFWKGSHTDAARRRMLTDM